MALLHEAQSNTAPSSQMLRDGVRRQSNAVFQAFAVVEGALIVMLSVACGSIYNLAHLGSMGNFDRYLGFGLAAAILFAISASARGLYVRSQAHGLKIEIKEVVLIWTMVFLCLMVVALAFGVADQLARGSVLLFFFAGLGGIAVLRKGGQRALISLSRSKGLSNCHVLVIAQSGQPVPISVSHAIEAYGGTVCKTVLLPSVSDEPAFSRRMVEVVDYVRDRPIDEVVLATSWTDAGLLEKITSHLSVLPVPVKLVPDPVVGSLLERPLVVLGSIRAIELQRAPLTRPQLTAKRLLDLLVAVPAFIVLLPLFAAIAVLIVIDSPGPVLFRQRRTGFNGRVFQIYKFRTMQALDDGAVVAQAAREDERVTRIGRVLRRSSIDELPQLLNVLKGEMSLVGPRPHALAHDDEYGRLIALYAARHKVKPGITGWAQVNGWRGGTPQVQLMMRRVEHDLWYANHWSLWLDIKILVLTCVVICTDRNAY